MTGGSEPEVYIGQAYGPFLLACHMDPDYAKDPRSPENLQCAGAAAFRANVGILQLMPSFLLRVGADVERVFATPAELVAHHRLFVFKLFLVSDVLPVAATALPRPEVWARGLDTHRGYGVDRNDLSVSKVALVLCDACRDVLAWHGVGHEDGAPAMAAKRRAAMCHRGQFKLENVTHK